MKKSSLGQIVLIIAIVAIIIALSKRLDLEGIGVTYGYLGVFIISLVSCATIIFPVSYAPVLIAISASTSLSPFWIGIFGGIGATIGEFTGYVLGRSGAKVFSEKWEDKIALAKRFFEKYGFWSVALISATPLPVGLMLFVAGLAKYSIIKLIGATIIGKVISVWILAYLGQGVGQTIFQEPGLVMIGIWLLIVAIAVLFYYTGLPDRLKLVTGLNQKESTLHQVNKPSGRLDLLR